MLTALISKVDTNLWKFKDLLNTAAFLDPRFKQLDPFVAENDREDVIEDVIIEVLLTCDQDHQDNKTVDSSSQLDDDDKEIRRASHKEKKRRSSFQVIG